jgi:class 3 adenylate cyclase/predicted ATPase
LMDVTAWLRGLGLEQYSSAFRDNHIDSDVLCHLTVADLIGLGVGSIGHRRKLLAAIAALRKVPSVHPAPATPDADERPEIGGAERRQLTVMFCDLVGSTELSARLDLEDLRELITEYQRAVVDVITSFDGFVAKYMGDGVLVYFGYPSAHEDDAERAVRAGLGVVDAIGGLDVKSVILQARVGIATGLVVVGDLIGKGSAQEQSVVGQTPNLAARLQSLAEPGAVVIAASTRRLVGGLFEYRDLGTIDVKGIADPVPTWQVLRPSAVASRFEALRGSTLSRLVGRDEEIDLLMRRWERAKAGIGQVVLVAGEPGLGKSRIAVALGERIHGSPHFQQRYFCSPYRRDSALYPFIDQIGRAAGFTRADSSDAKLEKLETLLARASLPDEDVGVIADLVSLPVSQRYAVPNLTPQRRKEWTLEALIRRLERLACRQPVLMIVEDAHWIDPTSLELLDVTVQRLRNMAVLVIITFRPEFQPPWSGEPQVTTLVLNRLDRRDRHALAEQIAGKTLPNDVLAHIVERTDGVPLFIEELTKSVLESGLLREEVDRYVLDGPLPPLAIPTSLHGSLMARLDRSSPVRHVAQIGAAFGRWFRYTSMRSVASLPEEELQASLARLVASELVFQSGTPPEAVYTFKHALVQEAAYGSLLHKARRQLHGRIAETLETNTPELINSQPELFARHYTEAGLVEKSVYYWRKAAQRSVARSAMAEAAAQFQKALDQLMLLPDDLARQRSELELRSSLGTVLQSVKGYAAPETGQMLGRARELWEQLGSPSEFFQVSYAQSLYHEIRGELNLAHRLDQHLLLLSRRRDDPAGLVLAHQSLGRNSMFAGRFASSRKHLEQVIELCELNSGQSFVRQAGVYPRVASQAFLAITLFCLGHPAQALARATAAIGEARKLSHGPSLAVSLTNGARLLSLAGNDSAIDEWAGQLVTVAAEQGFLLWRAMGTVYRGWVRVAEGDVAEGISLLRQGSAAYRATGAEAFVPYQIALLARACEIAGQIEVAIEFVDDALQIVERTGERWLAAELCRHKGQLLLRQARCEAAEEFYRKALSIAREQKAKLWELRAAAGLARLRRDQGWHAEARDLLAPVHGWFSEGFDTPDLKEAKALLAELA